MIVVQRIRPDRAEGFCGKPLWAEERERGRATMPSDLAWYGPALLNWSTWLLICIHHQVRCFQVHHSAFSTVPSARIIATQGRKEDGGYWASKWPSGLVTHLVCLINAHVMKLRRGKKLHGRSSNHAESQQQDNLINFFSHLSSYKHFQDIHWCDKNY